MLGLACSGSRGRGGGWVRNVPQARIARGIRRMSGAGRPRSVGRQCHECSNRRPSPWPNGARTSTACLLASRRAGSASRSTLRTWPPCSGISPIMQLYSDDSCGAHTPPSGVVVSAQDGDRCPLLGSYSFRSTQARNACRWHEASIAIDMETSEAQPCVLRPERVDGRERDAETGQVCTETRITPWSILHSDIGIVDT